MIYAATGHRPNKLGGYDNPRAEGRLLLFATDWLSKRTNISHIISGMALGWDTAWTMAALALKLNVTAAVPCDNQEALWPSLAQVQYREMLKMCSDVVVVSPGPYEPWKMQARNEWMVNKASYLAALWDGSDGGTANCVRYAEQRPLLIKTINLWPEWVKYK